MEVLFELGNVEEIILRLEEIQEREGENVKIYLCEVDGKIMFAFD